MDSYFILFYFLILLLAGPITILPNNHQVIQFWRALSSDSLNDLEDKFVLPQGSYWMGESKYGSSLYIRPVYNRFWEIITGAENGWILTGTPGIGKTFFTFFLFLKIRKTQPDAIIVRINPDKALVFYPGGGVHRTDSKNISDEITSKKTNWVIADSVVTEVENMKCQTVMVTSPKMSGYERHRKLGFEVRCMPVWDLSEIEKLREHYYPHVDQEEVEDNFDIWGGVPRTVLQFGRNISWQRHMRIALNIGTITKCMEFDGQEGYDNISDVCGRLVHLIPMDDVYVDTQIQWASQKLANFALDTLIAKNAKEAINLILSTQGSGSYGSLRGDLFEKLAHRIISAGGDFMVRDLETDSTSQESFKSYPTFQFKEIREVKKGYYNIPRSKNFATIDSLVPPDNLFQMTVSTTHSINERGLERLNLPGGPIKLYFITPEACLRNFKKAKLGEAWRTRIKQSVVAVELSKEIVEEHGNQNHHIMRWGMKHERDQDDEDGSRKHKLAKNEHGE